MATTQPDLFRTESADAAPPLSDEFRALIVAGLHQRLDRVRTAEMIPWDRNMELIQLDNYVRDHKHVLPPEEAAAFWAEFDFHMTRLFALLNEGLDPDTLED